MHTLVFHWCPYTSYRNRGYYMATRRYEISLPLVKNISLVRCAHSWNIFSTGEEKFCISKRPNHSTLIVFWCERRDLLCSHSKGDIFTCEDNMYFLMRRYQVFARKLTWYFIGVYTVAGCNLPYVNVLFLVCTWTTLDTIIKKVKSTLLLILNA